MTNITKNWFANALWRLFANRKKKAEHCLIIKVPGQSMAQSMATELAKEIAAGKVKIEQLAEDPIHAE